MLTQPDHAALLRARSLLIGWQLPAVIAGWAMVTVATHFGPQAIALPDLGGAGPVLTPLGSLGAVVCAVLAVITAGEPCPQVFITAPRRARHVNLTRVAVVALLGPIIVSTLGPATWAATTNTTLALSGEGLIAASLLGIRLAWLPISLHFLAAATVGAATRDSLHGWAWILETTPTSLTIAISAGVMVLGVILWGAAIGRNSDLLEF